MLDTKRLITFVENRIDCELLDHTKEKLEAALVLLESEGFIQEIKKEEPKIEPPTIEEILDAIRNIEDDTEAVANAVYNLATGKKSIGDYDMWKATLRLYIDEDLVDRDDLELSHNELVIGHVGLGDFAIMCPTSDIEYRVNEFIRDKISSWNGEDDADFNETWFLECDFGCSHKVEVELEIERT